MNLEKELKDEIEFEESFKHIPYRDKIVMAYESLLSTDPKTIMKRGRDVRDESLGGIYPGKIYTIGANTGIGKSTFVNQICNNVSKQGFRVVKYSLEDKMSDIGKEDIYTMINKIRKDEGKNGYPWIAFVNGELNKNEEFKTYVDKACGILVDKDNLIELDKTKTVKIDELIKLMEEEVKNGAKLFAIDHLHYFEMDGGQRHDLQIQNVMHQINEVARKYDVAIFIVAHYRKNQGLVTNPIPDLDQFKDGAAIKQVTNIAIQFTRDYDDDQTYFFVTKLRGPIKPKQIVANFNLSTFEYDFREIDENSETESKQTHF